MPIINNTPKGLTEQVAERIVENLERAILYNLKLIGEKCINTARSKGNYLDQTGNLRSSIGYVITRDGQIVNKSTFSTVKNGNKGGSDGLAYAQKLTEKFPQGFCLIVVAGMNYAYHVEKRGYNVLQTSELLAKIEAEKMLKRLGIK